MDGTTHSEFAIPIFSYLKEIVSFFSLCISFGFLIDRLLPEESKNYVAAGLKRTFSQVGRDNFARLFIIIFDRLFDPNGIGRPRFWRSAIVSCLALTFVGLYQHRLIGEPGSSIVEFLRLDTLTAVIILLPFAIPINLIGDYFSLWETRFLIGYMASVGTMKKQFVFLALDLLVTTIIFIVTFIFGHLLALVFLALVLDDWNHSDYGMISAWVYESVDLLSLIFFDYGLTFSSGDKFTNIMAVFFATTLVTSIWIWVFMIGVVAWRILWGIGARLIGALPVDKKPVTVTLALGGAIIGFGLIFIDFIIFVAQ